MNIALIIYGLNKKGGSQRQALEFAQELKRLKHTVTLYTFNFDAAACFTDLLDGLKVVSLSDYYPKWNKKIKKFFGVFSRPSYIVNYKQKRYAALKLAELIDKNIDILNPHGFFVYQVAYYFQKKVNNVPSVWMLNTMTLKSWGLWKAQEINKNFRASFLKKVFYKIADGYEIAKFLKKQNAIIVLGNREREWVKYYFNTEATVIRSGLRLEKFPYCERVFSSGNRIQALSVAILEPHRRLEDIIYAIFALKNKQYDISLSIVGRYSPGDVYFQHLHALAQSLNLSSAVTFLGEVSDQKLKDLYQTQDVFISSNHLQSWGLAVFEAMASGIPVVVSKSVGASEVLTNAENALLVDPKDPSKIAHAIERIHMDNSFRAVLIKNARRFVAEHITWQRYTQGMLEVFGAVLQKHKNRVL